MQKYHKSMIKRKAYVIDNPKLAAEWDYERNEGITPDMVLAYSNKKYYWRCKKGHSWETTPYHRAYGTGCPYCIGKLPIVGETDLATVNPELAAEWDYNRNEGVTPEMVTAYSGKKVFWKCKEGHSWKASINHRAKGSGCPYCSGRLSIIGETDLATVNPELATEWDYDWNKGITPDMVTAHSGKKVFWRCEKGHSWMASPDSRLNGHGCPYCVGQLPIVGETDLATLNPELAAEWDYERNEGITPDMVLAYSNKKYYWRCKKGHSWETTPYHRAYGTGCPYCIGKLPIVGETDLATVNPELAAEWDYNRNEGVTPEMVTAYSGKKVFWKCKEGHSWKASINHRAKGSGCPYCSGRLSIIGETDLATVNPELATEWDYDWNKGITPDMVTAHSGKKVFWRCKKGHSWRAAPATRLQGHSCPYCSGLLPIVGETDLATVNPRLANEWDYERNKGVTPEMVTAHSSKKYYWRCKKGHSWMASVASRSKGTGCPYCK